MPKSSYLKKELYELIKKDDKIFDFIQHSSLDGMWYWDLENPENEWMNERFWTVLGYNPNEMPHKSSAWQKIINQDDLKEALHNFTKHCEDPNHPYDQIVRYTHKNGSTVWIRCRGLAIRDKDGKAIRMLGAHHDITAIKRGELLLKEKNEEYELLNKKLLKINEELYQAKKKAENSEARFRNLFEHHSAIMLLIEPETGKIIDANRSAVQFYGYDLSTLKSKFIQDINQLNQEQIKKERLRALAIKCNYFIFPHKLSNGKIRTVEVHSTPIQYEGKQTLFSIIHDVTEREKAKKSLEKAKGKLEKNEELYRSTFKYAAVGIAHVDVNGNLTKVNDRFCEIIGYSKEELYGLNISDISDPEDLLTEQEYIKQILSNKINTYALEKRYIHKDGHSIWVILFSNVVRDKNNNIRFAVATISEITEQVKLKDRIIEAKEKAEKSDKLKTAFLHNMSHEIRTPLNSIIGFSERLSSSSVPEEKKLLYTDIIIKSGFQLLSIVNDVLTMSAIDTGQEIVENEIVNINSLLLDIEKVFTQKTNHQKFSLQLFNAQPDIDAFTLTDKTKLKQILTNLVSNAIKFAPKGTIKVGYSINDSMIEFFVNDNGIGIDISMHEAVFERFVQADERIQTNYGGTGLGLSICKGLVELLGGQIWVESELGKGSTFYFTIPYNPSLIENNDAPSPLNLRKNNSKVNITALVAEDHMLNFIYLEECLKELNFNVIRAKNGAEAVEVCKTNKSIDIVFMDIKMPVMDGYAASMLIKELRPKLTIIAQTAFASNIEIEKFGKAFDDYLTKPITTKKLIDILNKHIPQEL